MFVKFHKSGSRMFNRADVKVDTTGDHVYLQAEEEGLKESTKEMGSERQGPTGLRISRRVEALENTFLRHPI